MKIIYEYLIIFFNLKVFMIVSSIILLVDFHVFFLLFFLILSILLNLYS